jgi:hypothetical protein
MLIQLSDLGDSGDDEMSQAAAAPIHLVLPRSELTAPPIIHSKSDTRLSRHTHPIFFTVSGCLHSSALPLALRCCPSILALSLAALASSKLLSLGFLLSKTESCPRGKDVSSRPRKDI